MRKVLLDGFALLGVAVLVAACESDNRSIGSRRGQPDDTSEVNPRSLEESKMPDANDFTKSSHPPEDWPRLFTERLNAGDLDGAVALYEPDAHFVTPSGEETLAGRDRIRLVLAGLIKTKTRMQGQVIKVVTAGDIAVLYTNFEGATVDASGNPVQINQRAIEVLRRQPDGTWRLIVGDPNARGR